MNPLGRLFDVVGDAWRTLGYVLREVLISGVLGLLIAAVVVGVLHVDRAVVFGVWPFAVAGVYLVWCQVAPVWPCPRCRGKRYMSVGGPLRDRNCRRCGGKGVVRRVGAGGGA